MGRRTLLQNRLATEKSPYLVAHAMNPVWWQPWNEQTIRLAEKLKKPVLLSVGYSACHWCHVMAEESFADGDTARLMNDLFICIKVDKEERPDIDAIYQSALEKLGGRSGWPLTIILTPTLDPYTGGTYFPPEARHGLSSFKDFLVEAADIFRSSPEDAKKKGSDLLTQIGRKRSSATASEVTYELLNFVSNGILDNFDPVYGGFGQDAKFPQTGLIEVLWRTYLRTGHTSYRTAVIETLSRICQGSLFDHIRGGFFRYTVDDQWLVPHFEKMLYDNALLVSLLSQVHKLEPSQIFEDCVSRTCEWFIKDMLLPTGGFASSLSADSTAVEDPSKREEGAFYTWTVDEIATVLGDNSEFISMYLTFTPIESTAGKFIINKIDKLQPAAPKEIALINASLQRFAAMQDKRPYPQRDSKVLTDWNGLAIKSLVDAGLEFQRNDFIDIALDTYQHIKTSNDDDTSTLVHCSLNDEPYGTGVLDDYASMSQAALSLYEITGSEDFVKDAITWVRQLELTYTSSENDAYSLSRISKFKPQLNYTTARETATPSGNGTMVGVLSRLHSLVEHDIYYIRAKKIINSFSDEIPGHYLVMPTLINNSVLLDDLLHVCVIGPEESKERSDLVTAAHEASPPNLMVIPSTLRKASLAASSHPASGKTMLNGRATAYVCVGNTCFPPIVEAEKLRARINELLGLKLFHPE